MDWYETINEPPVTKLTRAIFENAFACAEESKAHITEERFATQEERHEQWGLIVWEYLFFFMHMFGRQAQKRLDARLASELCQELATHVVSGVTASMFPSSPQELKEEIQAEFLAELNAAEAAYSDCTQLMVYRDPLSDKGIVNLVGKRVAEVSGRPLNPITLVLAQKTAVDGWARIGMRELLDAIAGGKSATGKREAKGTFTQAIDDIFMKESTHATKAAVERVVRDEALPPVVIEALGRDREAPLSREEEEAVHEMFGIMGGMSRDPEGEWRFRDEDAEEMGRFIHAFGLWHLAQRLAVRSGYPYCAAPDGNLIEKAASAVAKAYCAFRLPILLYDLGFFFQLVGRRDCAVSGFKDFLINQSKFRPSGIARIWLNQRNVSRAIADAESKVGRQELS